MQGNTALGRVGILNRQSSIRTCILNHFVPPFLHILQLQPISTPSVANLLTILDLKDYYHCVPPLGGFANTKSPLKYVANKIEPAGGCKACQPLRHFAKSEEEKKQGKLNSVCFLNV